ncbi:MAG: hypothetical protein ACE5FS_03375 [Paracoccaceae bacterium]
MTYEHSENTGTLFKAEKKTDRHPDYTGTATINGTRMRIAAWIKDGKKGKFLSLAFTPHTPERRAEQPGLGDEIPF